MRLVAVGLAGLVACTVSTTTESRQRVERRDACKLLPELQSYDEWHGAPLFFETTRAVTLTYDLGDAKFIAYGVNVDAGTVDFVMVGPSGARDLFVAQIESVTHEQGVASTVAGKVGGGGGPRPPGDDELFSVAYLVDTATAMIDAARREPIYCER